MKKRLFAGVLAFLMVIGLLPLSMWYKPVSAKAEGSNIHTFNASEQKAFAAADSNASQKIITSDIFEVYGHKNTKIDLSKKTFSDEFVGAQRLTTGGASIIDEATGKYSAVVKFSVSGNIKIKVWWIAAKTDRQFAIYNGDVTKSTDLKNAIYKETPSTANGCNISEVTVKNAGEDTYYVGGTNSIYIYKIEVEELSSETSYDIKVVDSKSATKVDGDITSVVEGKDCTLEAADTDNFLYWVNSNNRIVSRDAKYTFPVYYADTYTAVYKSETPAVKFMTAYNQVYSTAEVNDELTLPDGPFRYGYTFKGWSKTIDQIKEEAGTSKSIEVKPVYELNVALFNVTINNKTESMNANTYVTAKSELGDKFAYWVDANSNILSYNSTYNFFVNGNIEIKEVSTDDIVDKVEAKGIINCVKQENFDTKSVIVFEYTVPEDCTIQFAGVVADESTANLTMDKAKFIRGEGTGSKNYRYTLSNSSGKTYNVKAVLKYTDSTGKVNEIESSVYTLN